MRKPGHLVPQVRNLLVVCAHPYDATFALGAVISTFVDAGTSVHLLCLTHGRRPERDPRHRVIRAHELGQAAHLLGVEDVTLLDYRSGHLATVHVGELTDQVLAAARGADALLTVGTVDADANPDHARAARAAFHAARKLGSPLYAWTVAPRSDKGHDRRHPTITIEVDRTRQRAAMACHRSLPEDAPLPRRWLTLRSGLDYLKVLRPERIVGPVRSPADDSRPAGLQTVPSGEGLP